MVKLVTKARYWSLRNCVKRKLLFEHTNMPLIQHLGNLPGWAKKKSAWHRQYLRLFWYLDDQCVNSWKLQCPMHKEESVEYVFQFWKCVYIKLFLSFNPFRFYRLAAIVSSTRQDLVKLYNYRIKSCKIYLQKVQSLPLYSTYIN
jgi:hypothetical protein